jgi:hypothetical protein
MPLQNPATRGHPDPARNPDFARDSDRARRRRPRPVRRPARRPDPQPQAGHPAEVVIRARPPPGPTVSLNVCPRLHAEPYPGRIVLATASTRSPYYLTGAC